MKNKGGRPIKLTDDMRINLIVAIKEGLTLKAACRCAGISYSTFANWRQQSRKKPIPANHVETAKLVNQADKEMILFRKKHFEIELANLQPRDWRYGWSNK